MILSKIFVEIQKLAVVTLVFAILAYASSEQFADLMISLFLK